ncbi:hypothetical protein [Paracoccus homiensis]|uniref:Flagellar protein FliL n=1 Tax=Paracoccus homiensis TaxID=364199 RepID=A0A1I0ACB6_9RHOB|nr:hypothetical protein [Paracoccus homiensis]SES91844.1 hypothetical protein SAMN04489858_102187 [Paracoccus homiensis]
MKKILTLVLPLIALLGGAFAGDMLRSDAAPTGADHADDAAHAESPPKDKPADHAKDDHGEAAKTAAAVFSFPGQFFVPLARNGDMGAMMILTLSLETTEDQLQMLQTREHRLRDALLRQLLIAANTGAFDGNYTTEARLLPLRESLLTAAAPIGDDKISAVLIEAIARQGG